MRIIYAWAKNAPSVVLPSNVGFRLGSKFGAKNLMLEIHYAHPLPLGFVDKSGFSLEITTKE